MDGSATTMKEFRIVEKGLEWLSVGEKKTCMNYLPFSHSYWRQDWTFKSSIHHLTPTVLRVYMHCPSAYILARTSHTHLNYEKQPGIVEKGLKSLRGRIRRHSVREEIGLSSFFSLPLFSGCLFITAELTPTPEHHTLTAIMKNSLGWWRKALNHWKGRIRRHGVWEEGGLPSFLSLLLFSGCILIARTLTPMPEHHTLTSSALWSHYNAYFRHTRKIITIWT